MKPKYNRLRSIGLPAFIIVPAMTFAFGGVINPDADGDITVTSANDGANTALASGGADPAPVVVVQQDAVLTGDAVIQTAISVTAPNYTIFNDGFLSGDLEGISVDMLSASGLTIDNSFGATITGLNDAIYLDGDGGVIFNSGSILGQSGGASDGIEGFSFLFVDNEGLISGNSTGILAEDDLDVLNAAGASIAGNLDEGIYALNDAFIDNAGTISSATTDAIVVFDDALIFNTGAITGATNGIFTGTGLDLVNEAGGVITGQGGVGVDAGATATIFNDSGALITGSLGGVRTGTDAQITNDGIVRGNGGDGISVGANGSIFNTGTIEGTTGIVTFDGSFVDSSGIIRSTAIGGNAFSGGFGDDTLFLSQGSLIEGNILGAGGNNNLTLSGGRTSPTSATNDIRGSVTNFNTITKEGPGLALIGTVDDVFSGLSITADTIQIDSGALYFNSNIAGATGPKAVINANGSAVGGTGMWDADLNVITGGFSAGAIPINLDSNPENSVGAVAIFGDVVHSPGSFIRMDIVPDTTINDGINSDIIEQIGVGNTYDVTGANLRIASTDANRVITPGTYIIVDSDEQIIGFNNFGTVGVQFNDNVPDTGQFLAGGSGSNYMDSVFTNFFVKPDLADGNTDLMMDVNYAFATLPGLTSTESALGGALDTLALRAGTGTLGLEEQDLISALALSDLGLVQDSLAGLSPESSVALMMGVVNSNYRIHRMVQDHLAQVRNNSGTMTMSTSQPVAMDGGKGGMTYSQPEPQSFMSRGTFWGSVSYDDVDYEDGRSGNDFDGDTGAITAGFDYRVSPMFVIGGLLDGSRSDFDSRGGSSEIDSFRAGVYGTYGEAMGLYSDFYVGYGSHELEENRFGGGIAGLAGLRNSSPDADSLQAMLTVGYAMGSQQVKHGPFIGLEYQDVDVDSYNQMSGPFNVGVDDFSIDSLRGLIGYRVNASFGALRPYASVAYAHEFEDDANFATARFAGVPFQVNGPQLESSVIVTAGTGYAFNANLMMNVGYRGDISLDDSGITSHGATLGLSYSF